MVNVECSGCGAPYSLSEKRIPDNGLKMRCPKCGESFMVHKPGGPSKFVIPSAPQGGPRPLPRRPKATLQGHQVPAATGQGLGAPPTKKPIFAVGGPPADDDLSVDGLLQAAERANPAPQGGGGAIPGLDDFGEVDDGFGVLEMGLPGGDGGGGADLPMTAMSADLPMPAMGADLPMPVGGPARSPFAEPELPMAVETPLPSDLLDADLPMPAMGADLPIAVDGELPMPAGYGDLPMTGGHDNLPMPLGHDNLPIAAGHDNLPLPAGYDNLPLPAGNLPIAAGNNLPIAAGNNLPMALEGNLPMPAGHADLPLPAGDMDLPLPHGGGDLPLPGGALPVPAGQDLPLPHGGGDLPLPGGSLPLPHGGGDLPMPGAGLPFPAGELPSPGGDFNLPDTFGTSADDAIPMDGFDDALGAPDQDFLSGGEFPAGDLNADLVSEPPRPGPPDDAPRRDGGSVGDEFNIDQVEERVHDPRALDDQAIEAPADGADGPKVKIKRKRSMGLRLALVALPLLTIGGGLLYLTPLGPFGTYAIIDTLNADTYQQRLQSFRQAAQDQLASDTAEDASGLLQRGQTEVADMPRYVSMKAYTAFVAFQLGVRFGTDPETMAIGKQLIEQLPPDTNDPLLDLAKAAQAAADGQAAAAASMLMALDPRLPGDVDLLVLSGEVALMQKAKDATATWQTAVKAAKSARTLYGLARAQIAGGKPDEGQKTAEEVLKLSKNHAGARALIATTLWQKSKKDPRALELLKEITQKGPVQQAASRHELVSAYSLLGDIHLSQSKVTAAEKSFAQALKLDPKSKRALIGSGELFYQAGRYTEALARFKSAYQIDQTAVLAAVGKAKTMIALESAKEAKNELLAAAKTTKHPLVGYWLGQAHLALGNKADAEKSYRAAIKSAGTHPDVVFPYVALADLLDSKGKRAEAEEVLTQASEKLPKSAALHNAKGDVALKAGRLEDAQREFEAALKIEPDNSLSRFKLGVTHRRAGHYELASKRFDEVAADDPEFPGLALERGLLFAETGNIEKSLKMYQDALKKAPDDVDLKLRVGSTLVISGHPDKALKHLRAAYAKKPQSAEANHFLGRALLLNGDSAQEALRFLEAAVRHDPNQASYHLFVAWAANESGQPALAEAAINKSLEIDRNLGDAYWQRGVLLQKRGQTIDALEELEIALEKNPSRSEAYATMARCYTDQTNLGAAEEAWRKAIAGNKWMPEWQFRLGKLLSDRGAVGEGAPYLRAAVDIVNERKQTPGWLWNANWLLGEALRGSEPKRAVIAYKEFLRLSTSENAYRSDAEVALDAIEERP
jgi:predicted Zn finger-like uncharacterized protein